MAQLPIIVQLPSLDRQFTKSNLEGKYSYNHDYPQFSLGFHYFLHQNIEKLDVSKFEGKKPIYRVINPFEESIDEHETDINHLASVYFSVGPKPAIVDRSFYKLWEMIMMFDLIDVNSKDSLTSAHLADGPGGFLQATLLFREMFAKGYKTDKYHAVTLHKEDESHTTPINDQFAKYYQKEKNSRVQLHQTYSVKQSGGNPDRDNGDITKLKTIRLFGGGMSGKANLVTANGGVGWKSKIVREQEAMKLILGQILAALTVQAKGGHLVLKFYETYTRTTSRLISLLNECYELSFMCKPLMSRPTDSERYFIGKRFKLDEKSRSNVIGRLAKILNKLENPKENLVHIEPSLQVDKAFAAALTYANTQISTQQYMTTNDTVAFIKSDNYYGDTYQDSRDKQIESTKYWVDRFFVSKDKLTKVIKDMSTDTQKNIAGNKDGVLELFNAA